MKILCAMLFAAVAVVMIPCSHAQEVHTEPGRFDFYVLSMSWSPSFCDTLQTLTPHEREEAKGDLQCAAPDTFALHGLWPQNFNGTYPVSCTQRPGPLHPERNLDMTPSLPLLKHEWMKHGTCTTLSPEAFFATARQAYTSVTVPSELKRLDHEVLLPPEDILGMFYRANPSFPQGSFSLSCSNNRLTAVETCFDKDVHAIACQGLHSCRADKVRVTPQDDSGIVK